MTKSRTYSIISCTQCKRLFEKADYEINRSISGNIFCSLSCGVKYNNRHKKNVIKRSKLEEILEESLNSKYSNLDIIYSDREILEGLELDIYIPTLKLAFEINGIHHYEPIFGQEKFRKTLKNDYIKELRCKNLRYSIIQY